MGELNQEVVQCVERAAAHYRADATRVLASLRLKDGKNGEIRVLPSGEVEVGLAQIPGKDVAALAKNAITPRMLADNDCLNVTIATYLFQRDELARGSTGAAVTAGGQGGSGLQQAQQVSTDIDSTLRAMSARLATGSYQTPVQRQTVSARPQENDQCVLSAAARYAIPLQVFQAVLRTEGGWTGLRKRNSNGSYDMGPAQINTIHLPELRQYGITESALINDTCTNLHVAAYRIRSEINRTGDFWRGIGNYHSRTPKYHQIYLSKVQKHLSQILGQSR